jgi:hypothetical protein
VITTLDIQSWAKELVTGNAAFIEDSGVLYIVSNVRADNSFAILQSDPVPPAPGPGSSFTEVASHTFATANTDFDPVVEIDPTAGVAGVLHIIGVADNATDPNLDDVVKFSYDIDSATLTGPVVLVTGSRVRDAYDIVVLAAGHTLVAASVDEVISYLDGTVTPQLGMNLVVMELDGSDVLVPSTTVELVNSPPRSGDTFSSVSVISPDGVYVELYYESHPKLVSFDDHLFKFRQFNRDNVGTWDTVTDIGDFQGRFTDDRLTVLANGDDRLLTQVYFNQLARPVQGLVGNLVMGFTGLPMWDALTTYLAGDQVSWHGLQYEALLGNTGNDPSGLAPNWKLINGWTFHTIFGTTVNGSVIQATPCISISQGMNIVYLLEPFNSPAEAWPMHVATIDSNLLFTDVPGFYNQQTFTWLRGTTSILDDDTRWAIVGERMQGLSPSPLPVYVSLFDVPPTAAMIPTSATVYRGASFYDIGAGLVSGDLPLHVNSADADQDALIYVWSKNDPDLRDVTLVTNGPDAVLDVARAVGGAARSFTVGVAVIDLFTDLITPRHPSLDITNIDVTASVLTVTAANNYAPGETAMLYDIALAAPVAPTVTQVASGTPVATITNIDVTSGILTVTAVNSFNTDDKVSFAGLTTATYLNGEVLIILNATPTDFTAAVSFGDDPSHADTGTATSPVARKYSIKITYVNGVGQSTGSDNFLLSLTDGNVAKVTSPLASGNATAYNVFVAEVLAGTTSWSAITQTPIVTHVNITSGTLTVTAVNTLAPGDKVLLSGLDATIYLNGLTFTVLTASGTQFTAAAAFADDDQVVSTGAGQFPAYFAGDDVEAGGSVWTAQRDNSGVDPTTDDGTNWIKVRGNLQNNTPILLGTDWTEPDSLLVEGAAIPLVNTAFLTDFNNDIVTVATASLTQFTAPIVGTMPVSFPSTAVVGFASTQFQFATCDITVPSNAAPTITLQAQFVDAVITLVEVDGSNNVIITAANGFSAGQKVQFQGLTAATFLNGETVTIATASGTGFTAPFAHAVYPPTADTGTAQPQTARGVPFTFTPVLTGYNDIDDATTFTWVQTAGDPVSFEGGTNLPTLKFETLGLDLHGETLTFSLTVDDGVNAPVTETGFVVHVEAYDFSGTDTLFLSRALFTEQTDVDFVSLTSDIATIVAVNNFIVGQMVEFKNLTTATFLNGQAAAAVVSVLNADLAGTITQVARSGTLVTVDVVNSFTAGQIVTVAATTTVAVNGTFVLVTATGTQITYNTAASGAIAPVADTGTATVPAQFTIAFTHTDYALAADAGDAYTPARMSQRNTSLTWQPLQTSAMLTDLATVKRSSVLDGSDRYLLISSKSVTVFGGINPALYLLRKLFTPAKTNIVDCVHTEQDYSLVLDDLGNLFRYTEAPLINTDNPDVTIDLTNISSFSFNKIFTTPAFADKRVIVLSGSNGIVLLQVQSSTLGVLAFQEYSAENGFLYGSDNVQFVRTNAVESLREGKILVGSIVPSTATITKMRVLGNDLIVTANNTFKVGARVQFTGITLTAGLLDINDNAAVAGRDLVVTSANATGFTCSILHADAGTGPSYTETGTVTATNEGTTYETLISLANSQIIGTWDASKIRNQFVESGEILFEPESTYVGRPPAPIQAVPSAVFQTVTIAWVEERPDLVFAYDVEYSTDGGTSYNLLQRVNSGATLRLIIDLIAGQTYLFRIRAFSQDGASNYSNVQTITL